jgi:hypothetical protein
MKSSLSSLLWLPDCDWRTINLQKYKNIVIFPDTKGYSINIRIYGGKNEENWNNNYADTNDSSNSICW